MDSSQQSWNYEGRFNLLYRDALDAGYITSHNQEREFAAFYQARLHEVNTMLPGQRYYHLWYAEAWTWAWILNVSSILGYPRKMPTFLTDAQLVESNKSDDFGPRSAQDNLAPVESLVGSASLSNLEAERQFSARPSMQVSRAEQSSKTPVMVTNSVPAQRAAHSKDGCDGDGGRSASGFAFPTATAFPPLSGYHNPTLHGRKVASTAKSTPTTPNHARVGDLKSLAHSAVPRSPNPPRSPPLKTRFRQQVSGMPSELAAKETRTKRKREMVKAGLVTNAKKTHDQVPMSVGAMKGKSISVGEATTKNMHTEADFDDLPDYETDEENAGPLNESEDSNIRGTAAKKKKPNNQGDLLDYETYEELRSAADGPLADRGSLEGIAREASRPDAIAPSAVLTTRMYTFEFFVRSSTTSFSQQVGGATENSSILQQSLHELGSITHLTSNWSSEDVSQHNANR